MRRLRPRLGHGGHRPLVLRARNAAPHDRQAVGDRLLVEDAHLLRGRRPRLQLGPRPHALHRHRRQRRQPRPDLHRHLRRRRFAVDRDGSARSRHPPQRGHAVRDREQRRVRPHQGAVLGLGRHRLEEQARRGEPLRPHRPGFAGPRPRGHLRGPQLLGRQGTAGADPQGGAVAQGLRPRRRDLALRDLQRSRRLDEELPAHPQAPPPAGAGGLRPLLRCRTRASPSSM